MSQTCQDCLGDKFWNGESCEFCTRHLCLRGHHRLSSPTRGGIAICNNCKKQFHHLKGALEYGLEQVVKPDCASIIISYLCVHSIMNACPLWGFLARIRIVEEWVPDSSRPKFKSMIVPRSRICGCGVESYPASEIQIGLDAKLYPDKPPHELRVIAKNYNIRVY
jgi:hypothetical protein